MASTEWIQVRLRRDTADRLRDFAARLAFWARENPRARQPWLDCSETREVSFDLAVLTLLYREDVKAARSVASKANLLDRKAKKR